MLRIFIWRALSAKDVCARVKKRDNILNTKGFLRNQKGFTLIEMIAVLIILGILAAMAVPRYMALQEEARQYAVEGALGALAATAYMDYAYRLLQSPANTEYMPTNSEVGVGDFTGKIEADNGEVTLTVTGGPVWLDTGASYLTKTIKLY